MKRKAKDNTGDVLKGLSAPAQVQLHRHRMLVQKTLDAVLGTTTRLSTADGIRSLVWASWALHHGVELQWIIQKAIEYGTEITGSRVRRNKNILPASIAAMTGPMAKQYLWEAVAEDFAPFHKQNALRERMIHLQVAENTPERIAKGLLDFDDLDAYTEDYEARTRARRAAREDAVTVLEATSKPFVGNPFRIVG